MGQIQRSNERTSEKVVARIFGKAPQGFEGGLSADNYIKMTRLLAPPPRETLNDLVEKGALIVRGTEKHPLLSKSRRVHKLKQILLVKTLPISRKGLLSFEITV